MSRARASLAGLCALAVLALAFWAWGLRTPRLAVPQLTGELRTARVEVEGHRRSFRYYVPARPAPKPALVLALHGSMGNGEQMRRFTGYDFDLLADRHGFLVAYPDAYEGLWNDCRRSFDVPARNLGIDDVEFMRATIGWLEREHGVDRDRVLAFGVSNGGHMAYRLALEAPGVVRAVVADAASLPTEDNQGCRSSGRPPAVMVINGTDDPINPYAGGEVSFLGLFLRRGTVRSTMATARHWAALAGHSGEPSRHPLDDADPGDGTRSERLTWASEGRPEVSLITVMGGGHAIPHPKVSLPRVLGRTSHDFSAAEEAWRFFERQLAEPPRPAS